MPFDDPKVWQGDPTEERDILWAILKKQWQLLEQIERGAYETRKSLPADHPLRMRLLTLETMAKMGLAAKREVGRKIKARLDALLTEWGEAPGIEGDDWYERQEDR